MTFKAIDDQASREQHRRFACSPVVGADRLCEVASTGIAGTLRLIVDSTGHAVVVQFRPDSATPFMREEGRRIAAEWNVVRHGEPGRIDPSSSEIRATRWTSADSRWSASMHYGKLDETPVVVTLSDERAIERIKASTPMALMVLSIDGLIDPPSAAELERASRHVYGRGTIASADSAALAPGSVLSVCEAAPPDMIVDGDARSQLGADLASLVEQAVPLAYPGARIVFGQHAYFVDSTGRAEWVSISAQAHDYVRNVDAIALEFPRRIKVAAERLKAWPAQPLCRATADIVFSHHSSGGTEPLDVRRFPLDVDAVSSSITMLSFASLAASDHPLLAVEFLSSHAGAGWTGSVQWNAFIATDPVREVGRIPSVYGKHLVGADSATREGYLKIVGETAAGVELSALAIGGRALATTSIVIPPGRHRSGSGAALLSRL